MSPRLVPHSSTVVATWDLRIMSLSVTDIDLSFPNQKIGTILGSGNCQLT